MKATLYSSAIRSGSLAVTAVILYATLGNLNADDWMTWQSTYTHDPYGQPVDQYSQPIQPLAPDRSGFVRSGYRHFRSTLQVGQSADNFHIVDQWGAPVVPYEAWRFPFRPYGVPYDAWGPPVGLGGWGGWSPFAPGIGIGPFPNANVPNAGMYPEANGPLGYPNTYLQPNNQGNFGVPNPQWIPGYPRPGYVPLQPSYQGQPWYDGTYPSAPPLDNRSDEEFFYRPPRLGPQ